MLFQTFVENHNTFAPVLLYLRIYLLPKCYMFCPWTCVSSYQVILCTKSCQHQPGTFAICKLRKTILAKVMAQSAAVVSCS